ncbi:GSCFA domain-containing protein [Polaribacter sp. SA4-12]|uniref:GSCFA domain-containing protein n=1 Tax=Polaribacter sp. SA4-12 TaxID=1312072 RepID=UPI000B3D130B|nr:GSCFA domain-containing protein [Polaribacter sp. SA4-12]ARV15406.1 GSCFA domain-containing protein [Polaribacter sp. SA4-12]
MQLQTIIPLKKEIRNPIDYNSKLLLLGSCFSENIGDKLNYFKFQTNQNPFGILFHPKAIENLITNAINEKEYVSEDLIFQNERWHCFDAHSHLSSPNKNELLDNLNSAISATNKQLKEATHIIITLGTSWVYRFIETDTVVANCHKIPQKKFLKELLSVDEIIESLEATIALLKYVNKDVNVLFTVSPIRHLKDGFLENTQSKSHLITAIHSILNTDDVSYFPSYEIMMDELRDYRFYAEDMVHPNKTAINYIWERFIEIWISENSKPTMQEVETIQKGISHRPFNENSEQHQKFLKNLDSKISKIQSKLPFIKF